MTSINPGLGSPRNIRYTNFGHPRRVLECVQGLSRPLYDASRPSAINICRVEKSSSASCSDLYIGEKNVGFLHDMQIHQIVADDIPASSAQLSLQFYLENFCGISNPDPGFFRIFGGLFSSCDVLSALERSSSFFSSEADGKRVLLLSVDRREIDLASPDVRTVFDALGFVPPETPTFHDFGAVVQMLRVFPDGAALNTASFIPFEFVCAQRKE